ncbi:hypothetical protein [Priestia megaterium]|uniref:hypothetical protein n=1 Tax=Priestia megaterium TaxID=1404 RepID=UPI00366CEEA6
MASAQPHVIQSRQDIINFVNSNPVTSKSWKIILVALGGIFVDAYDFTSLGIGADQLKEQFNLSPAGLGSLTAIMAFGACFVRSYCRRLLHGQIRPQQNVFN